MRTWQRKEVATPPAKALHSTQQGTAEGQGERGCLQAAAASYRHLTCAVAATQKQDFQQGAQDPAATDRRGQDKH